MNAATTKLPIFFASFQIDKHNETEVIVCSLATATVYVEITNYLFGER